MDSEWFSARMQLLGIVQEDIARALRLDRSTVSRVQAGQRPLSLREVEPLAVVLEVPPIEILERAHKWQRPIRIIEVRTDLLLVAVSCAKAVLADEPTWLTRELARLAVGVYGQLIDSEAAGQPIAGDERALRLIEDTLRRQRSLDRRRNDPD